MLVVGGGASGLGVALDAASRGLRTLLVERGDFAGATSSRSTKLVHGGVRYLRRGEVALVREALRERGRMIRNAPGLVRPLPFVLPSSNWIQRSWHRVGLGLYDRLAGDLGVGDTRALSAAAVTGLMQGLARPPRGGCLFHDAQFDDAALALSLVRTIRREGGVARNHTRVVALRHGNGEVRGAEVEDSESGERAEVRAATVVNATGVFSDTLRRLDRPEARTTVTQSRGSHLVLPPEVFPGEHALLVPKTSDGRVLFAIPWMGAVLFGTTDVVADTAEADPAVSDEETEYLLGYANEWLAARIEPDMVRSRFAGLRPLVRPERGASTGTAAISREHVVEVSRTGMISLQGGKWTTYRSMAQDVMDRVAPDRPCRTADLPLEQRPSDPFPLDEAAVRAAVSDDARTLDDVLARRSRWLLLDARGCLAAAPEVAGWLAAARGRDGTWAAAELARFRKLARNYLTT